MSANNKPKINDVQLPAGFANDAKSQFKTGKVSQPSSFLITINSNKSQKTLPNAEWANIGRRLLYLGKLIEWHLAKGDFIKKKNPSESLILTNFKSALEKSRKKTEAHLHVVVQFNIACQFELREFNQMIYDNCKPEIATKPYVNVMHFRDIAANMHRYLDKQSMDEQN